MVFLESEPECRIPMPVWPLGALLMLEARYNGSVRAPSRLAFRFSL